MLKDDLGPDAVVLSNRAANGGVGDPRPAGRRRGQPAACPCQAAAAAARAHACRSAPCRQLLRRPRQTPPRILRRRFPRSACPAPPRPVAPPASPPAAPRLAPSRAPECSPFNPPRVELSRDVFHAASAQVRRPPATAAPPPSQSARRCVGDAPRADRAPTRPSARIEGRGAHPRPRIRQFPDGQRTGGHPQHDRAPARRLRLGRDEPQRIRSARLLGDLLKPASRPAGPRAGRRRCRDEAPETPTACFMPRWPSGFRAMNCDADIIDRGGVFALVGPTGVGQDHHHRCSPPAAWCATAPTNWR